MNRKIVLAGRPMGWPKLSDFELVEDPVPEPGDGEFLVRNLFLSLDPYQRGRMNEGPSYAASVGLGEAMVGGAVGEIEQSRHPGFKRGDTVVGRFGWQLYAVSDGRGVRQVDPGLAPVSTALGILGMPGLTAYFGLLDIGRPKPGDCVVVTSAAGAVGSAVGQIAKVKECRVVGVAGSDAKVQYIREELGFDEAFNYKTVKNTYRKLKALCSDLGSPGIDVYFDNVGGAVTDAVFRVINIRARIVICGQISQYNLTRPEMGPRFLWQLIVNRARVEGFLVSDYLERYDEGLRNLARWINDGKIRYREDVAEGLENAPEAFIGMLRGKNQGKQLVKLS
jgi:NADPH-dependent curcumin reductase CurA